MRKWIIPFVAFILSTISLVTVKSVAPDLAYKQLMFFVIGFVAFFIISKIPINIIKNASIPGYYVLSFLLLLLLVTGSVTRGITGWFDLGFGIKFQPSQFAIPIVALFTIKWLETVDLSFFSKVLTLVGIIVIPGLLILVEPDFGTATVYFLSLGSLFLVLNIKFKYLLYLALAGIITIAMTWSFLLKPYQKRRITSFSTSSDQASAANYNARQSIIAVGSGGVFGRGVGFGIQSHLKFLPERQTDFIFASFAEEWGLMGSLLLVGLYLVLIVSIFYMAFDFNLRFNSLYAVIVGTMIAVQVGINIGMNIGLIPITGITLPLISYGGSSITAIFVTLGILQNMVLSNKKKVILNGT